MRLLHELELFQKLKKELETQKLLVEKLDEHGFAVFLPESKVGSKIDLLITGLIHGDEVIGIEVINLLLSQILVKTVQSKEEKRAVQIGEIIKRLNPPNPLSLSLSTNTN